MTKYLLPGLAALALVAIVVALFFGGPIRSLLERQRDKAVAGQEAATDGKVVAELTVEGERAIGEAVAAAMRDASASRGTAYVLERQTRADPTTASPIPAAELERLRAHDRSLCADGRLDCSRPAEAGAPLGS